MDLVAKVDEIGKPAWIGLMVLGFILFWPVGLALLVYLIWSGRMGCGRRGGWNEMRSARGRWYGPNGGMGWRRSSGNTAFDEYREETLRRLEEEQKEFMEFLDRLRQAKDKAEFDQFMNERRRGQQGSSTESSPQPQG
jgi:hypothetical protein